MMQRGQAGRCTVRIYPRMRTSAAIPDCVAILDVSANCVLVINAVMSSPDRMACASVAPWPI